MNIKFAHASDCHLGCWRKETLNQVGYEVFRLMIEKIIEEQVDFVLISGDLYDVSNPKVDVVDLVTKQLKKLNDAKIPVYGIMGSHDFSPSDKSMIRPLVSAELFRNVSIPHWVPDSNYPLQLQFIEDQKTKVKLVGMRARKRGLEIENYYQLDIDNLEQESGTKIFLLHTMITELKPKEYANMRSGEQSLLPRNFYYYAGGHLHKTLPEKLREDIYHINKDSTLQQKIIYPGLLFPTNFLELEKFQYGGFCIVSGDTITNDLEVRYIPLKCKEVERILVKANNKTSSTVQDILDQEIKRGNFEDKIVVVRLEGTLSSGKSYDIDINEILHKLREKGAYETLINKTQLISEEYRSIKQDLPETSEEIESRLVYEHASQSNILDITKEEIEQKVHQILANLGRSRKESEKVKDFDKEMKDLFYSIMDLKTEETE